MEYRLIRYKLVKGKSDKWNQHRNCNSDIYDKFQHYDKKWKINGECIKCDQYTAICDGDTTRCVNVVIKCNNRWDSNEESESNGL